VNGRRRDLVPFADGQPPGVSRGAQVLVESLAQLFGHGRVNVPVDSLRTETVRVYWRFADIVRDVADARVFAGLHFRFSTKDGEEIGRSVARLVARRHFQPVSRKP
jgi:hypothetical protein